MPRSWSTTLTEIILTSYGSNMMENRRSWDVFCSYTLPFFLISAWYKWRRHRFLPPMTTRVVSPCAGSPEWLPNGTRSGVRLCDGTSTYAGVSFSIRLYVRGWLPGSSAVKRGNTVTARHVICLAPGNRTHIVIATPLRCLPKILLLTSPLDLTSAPCGTIYQNISRIPTQPDTAICALIGSWTHFHPCGSGNTLHIGHWESCNEVATAQCLGKYPWRLGDGGAQLLDWHCRWRTGVVSTAEIESGAPPLVGDTCNTTSPASGTHFGPWTNHGVQIARNGRTYQ